MFKFKKNISFYIDNYRIFIMFGILFLFAAIFAPNFFNTFNLTSLLKGSSMYIFLAIGMTLIMICGHLDLSIQATMNLGAVLAIGLHTWSGLPWVMAILLAVLAGAIVGLINGLIVTKGKIHSFIVTLGSQIFVSGIIFIYTKSGSISTEGDFAFGDWLARVHIPLLPPHVYITVIAVIIMAIVLNKTRFGRGFYMVGGNIETAWLAGINTDKQITSAFVLSGGFAALGGALFAIAQSSAVPNLGNKGVSPLLVAIAAVIIGGTSMAGGKGGVIKSFFAVLTLRVISNALNCFGTGYEVEILVIGFVLALVVLYEALVIYKKNQIKGIRIKLLDQIDEK